MRAHTTYGGRIGTTALHVMFVSSNNVLRVIHPVLYFLTEGGADEWRGGEKMRTVGYLPGHHLVLCRLSPCWEENVRAHDEQTKEGCSAREEGCAGTMSRSAALHHLVR